MAQRAVFKTGKDGKGNIVALCQEGAEWSPRHAEDAIRDIDNGWHSYFVPWREGRTEIRVIEGPSGRYLRTDRDGSDRNNLDDLPDC